MAQYSAIASGVQNMDDIRQLKQSSKQLRFINLHGNAIRYISNLNRCYYLQELDLSSNAITKISGLEACESLLKLNLSCNQLKIITGLEFLYKLRTLNLSYNQIGSAKSLSFFGESRYKLENLLLHGNKLASIPTTLAGIKRILTLRSLTIHSNPLCGDVSYRRILTDCMPQLETIDDFERSEGASGSTMVSEDSSSVTTQIIDTPFIDKAVLNFRQGDNGDSEGDVEVREGARACPSDTGGADTDYTSLIKQVLNVLQTEEKPVKLERAPGEEVEQELRVPVAERLVSVAAVTRDVDIQVEVEQEHDGSTNRLLMAELEAERERRWKSEQHITELTDKLSKNERYIKEYEALNKNSEAGINGIREMLMKEQQQKLKLAELLEAFQAKHKEVVGVLSSKEAAIKKKDHELSDYRNIISELKQKSVESIKAHRTSLHHAKQETQVQRKECDILRNKLHDHEIQVKSLQELIVTREADHTRERANLVPLNGEEFRGALGKALDNEREKFTLMNQNLVESVRTNREQYADLEKEFRMALYLENERYEELSAEYIKTSGSLTSVKDQLNKLRNESITKSELIGKLKKGVEEQNGYIDKMRRSRIEIDEQQKTQIRCLEKELEESTNKIIQLTPLQKENEILKAEMSALESVISGLKSERALWSKELAEQGAQLSFDRGHLQAEVEKFKARFEDITAKHDAARSDVAVKEHQLSDAMDTISKLKDAVINKEKECEIKLRDFHRELQSIVEDRDNDKLKLESLHQTLKDSEEERDIVAEKLEKRTSEYDTIRSKYKQLREQWDEKMTVLSHVERQTKDLVKEHSEELAHVKGLLAQAREELAAANTKLLDAENNKEELVRQVKSEEEKQLSALRMQHQQVEQNYQAKISELEQEMRALLHQTEQTRTEQEQRMSKLAGALGEFTQLLRQPAPAPRTT